MKSSISNFYNQKGFSLLEILIALVIFSIVVLGTSQIMNYILKSQKEISIQSIILDQLQARIQSVFEYKVSGDVCNSINQEEFEVNGKTYYIGCDVNKIVTDGYVTEWPVLAASLTGKEAAELCATSKKLTDDCYMVGN